MTDYTEEIRTLKSNIGYLKRHNQHDLVEKAERRLFQLNTMQSLGSLDKKMETILAMLKERLS